MASTSSYIDVNPIKLKDASGDVLFVTWTPKWNHMTTENIESFEVKWSYTTIQHASTWFNGRSQTIKFDKHQTELYLQDEFTIPNDALRIRFNVKVIGKHQDDDSSKPRHYSTYGWTNDTFYDVITPPADLPGPPDISESTANLLVATYNDLKNTTANYVHFRVLKRVVEKGTEDAKRFEIYADAYPGIRWDDQYAEDRIGYVRYSCKLESNGEYIVRARASEGLPVKSYPCSEWTESSTSIWTQPIAPNGFTTIRSESETSVYLEWDAIETADGYKIQYTDNADLFDVVEELPTVETTFTKTVISDLETGVKHYFRICSVRNDLASAWSKTSSVTLGTRPTRPTTWSSSSTVVSGEPLVLCWIHNSEDGSKQTEAQIEWKVFNEFQTCTITTPQDEDDDLTAIHTHTIDTNDYVDTEISWKVRTKGSYSQKCKTCGGDGVFSDEKGNVVHCTECDGPLGDDLSYGYSKWSIERTATVYSRPWITMSLLDNQGKDSESLTALPLRVRATPGPISQSPISYHLTIVANDAHETNDSDGNSMYVYAGEEIFSRHYDISDPLSIDLSAGDVNFENNISYTITCSVTMDSGLTASTSKTFTTAWNAVQYFVTADISVDVNSYTTTILPYCKDDSGRLVENHTLAVYRRNYDGSLTKLMSGIENDGITHITDPHPSLDYARYRIVATSNTTGVVTYNDLPGVKVGGTAVILQWNEAWTNFESPEGFKVESPSWAGSLVKLPYNIDIKENVSPDISRVEYIGRKYPVSYHGTQLGESASWSTAIDKTDKETLYALRRLARWNGLVYVREPSGSGYCANVTVSISQKYGDMTIPVTFNITRVDGGD